MAKEERGQSWRNKLGNAPGSVRDMLLRSQAMEKYLTRHEVMQADGLDSQEIQETIVQAATILAHAMVNKKANIFQDDTEYQDGVNAAKRSLCTILAEAYHMPAFDAGRPAHYFDFTTGEFGIGRDTFLSRAKTDVDRFAQELSKHIDSQLGTHKSSINARSVT